MLTVIIGPMFSGKTTELLRRLERYDLAGKKVVLVRPQTDTRLFLSHSRLEFDGKTIGVKELKDLPDLADGRSEERRVGKAQKPLYTPAYVEGFVQFMHRRNA